MSKKKTMPFLLLPAFVCVSTVSCKDDGKDTPEPESNNGFESLDCATYGDDESICDFEVCQAKDRMGDDVSECEDDEESGCEDIKKCYNTYASCYLNECPAGSKASAGDQDGMHTCTSNLFACLEGGDPDDPLAVLDCDGTGEDSEMCNHLACDWAAAGEREKKDCEREDKDYCDELYQCYVDFLICYNKACPPGEEKRFGDQTAIDECNNENWDCTHQFDEDDE